MRIQHLLIVATAAAVLASCAREPIIETAPAADPNLIPLNIDGSISQVATKATAQGFVDGDAVGLYAVNYSENNTVAGTLAADGNQADNVKYTFNESAHKWIPAKSVFYKDVNTNVDLYLYYPYQENINDISEGGFEVKKDQSAAATATSLGGYEASDFLWGKATDITPVESAVAIRLSHKLSAVQVLLTEGTGFAQDEFEALSKSVIVTNTTRKATINYSTGVATALGEPQLDGIVMCPQTDRSFRAIVIPQAVEAGEKLFSITIDGIAYGFKQSAAVEYQAGKQLQVTITINKKSHTGDYELELANSQIIDWAEDLNTHGGEARQYYVVNVETPGTLGDVIAAAGKNPAKIRNLKIVGNVNADDFYFMRDNMAILEAVNMKEAVVISIPEYAFSEKKTLSHFSFPETVKAIGSHAFYHTKIAGALILPEGIESLGDYSFSGTLITSLVLPTNIQEIGFCTFNGCSSLTGSLVLPESLSCIKGGAFQNCNFSGHLSLPEGLTELGSGAFGGAGNFIGDLVIPASLSTLDNGGSQFSGSSFTGRLIFKGNTSLGSQAFSSCHFSGELVIPEGIVEIPSGCFWECDFTTISFPSTLKDIQEWAFSYNHRLGIVSFPDGLLNVGTGAFVGCNSLISLELPSSLQTINEGSFSGCFGITSIICNAVEPPTVIGDAFDGVSKDNFAVQVPPQSIKRYQAEGGWNDFRRIAAYYGFSLSRPRMRALNGAQSRIYELRAPANFSWSVDTATLPVWVTVSPSSGIGKTEVTISVGEMAHTNDTFEVNEGTFNEPSYVNYKGRSGMVVFNLDDKDCSFVFDVEQYDTDFPDGGVQVLQVASRGPGIDIVYTGDGYDAKDIAKGTFAANAMDGYQHLFDLEPYKSYKDYFNVYAVTAQSDDSGIGTLNTVMDSKFGTRFTQNRINCEQPDAVFAWAKKANALMNLSKSLVVLLMNASTYEGICYMYGDGSALACCPVSTNAYPYDYRGIIQHEAGGHGFGKLADEYIYHNAYIQICNCIDGCEHPQGDDDLSTSYGLFKSLGWFKNLSMSSDAKLVPWSHLIYHPQYSDYVDMFEGGYMHSRGIYRSEATSCMNNNIPYYSAISRQAIVERIKEYAGETFTLADFYANDDDSFGTITKAGPVDRTFGVDPNFHLGSGEDVVYMGEHPNVK